MILPRFKYESLKKKEGGTLIGYIFERFKGAEEIDLLITREDSTQVVARFIKNEKGGIHVKQAFVVDVEGNVIKIEEGSEKRENIPFSEFTEIFQVKNVGSEFSEIINLFFLDPAKSLLAANKLKLTNSNLRRVLDELWLEGGISSESGEETRVLDFISNNVFSTFLGQKVKKEGTDLSLLDYFKLQAKGIGLKEDLFPVALDYLKTSIRRLCKLLLRNGRLLFTEKTSVSDRQAQEQLASIFSSVSFDFYKYLVNAKEISPTRNFNEQDLRAASNIYILRPNLIKEIKTKYPFISPGVIRTAMITRPHLFVDFMEAYGRYYPEIAERYKGDLGVDGKLTQSIISEALTKSVEYEKGERRNPVDPNILIDGTVSVVEELLVKNPNDGTESAFAFLTIYREGEVDLYDKQPELKRIDLLKNKRQMIYLGLAAYKRGYLYGYNGMPAGEDAAKSQTKAFFSEIALPQGKDAARAETIDFFWNRLDAATTPEKIVEGLEGFDVDWTVGE